LLSNDIKVEDLPAKMKELQKKQEEEEKRKKEEEEKNLCIDTSITTPGGDEGTTPVVVSHRGVGGGGGSSTNNMVVTSPHEPDQPFFRNPLPKAPQHTQMDDPSVVWNQNFADKHTVSWGEFARFLAEHFQQVARVEYRPLSQSDLSVIKEKLETQSPSGKVTFQAFSWFWRWFRSLEDTINQIRDDWCKDSPKLIYGILARSHIEDLLRTSPVGTFLFRFSENNQNLGCIALAYVEENKSIRHTLIDIKGGILEMKTSGEMVHYFKSLSELVFSCRPLQKLYPSYDKNTAFKQDEEDDDMPH
jgi:hypothetical protein